MLVDLHAHTTASDGSLSPSELLERARAHGIEMLSITDHDTLAAYDALEQTGLTGLRLIPGIEFSGRWRNAEVHILGLNIDTGNSLLKETVARQQQARLVRAEIISAKLRRLGIAHSLAEIQESAGTKILGRPHFARYLAEKGHCRTVAAAFRKYLGPGKPGNDCSMWALMSELISSIHAAGGKAVLAHPMKYGFTRRRMNELISEFTADGGEGIEVISGSQSPEVTLMLSRICAQYGLEASCGSDFHMPDQPWSDLGRIKGPPASCLPVWHNWQVGQQI